MARGDYAPHHGNGGGIFVTTSRADDFAGAGHGAAFLYSEDGHLESFQGVVRVENNIAFGWGGGLYGGLVHELHSNGSLFDLGCNGIIRLRHAQFVDNTALSSSSGDFTLFPSHMAFECFTPDQNDFMLESMQISGNVTADIGLYLFDTPLPFMSNISHSSIRRLVVEETQ